MAVFIAAGLGAGALIAILTVLIEHSRIVFGPYPLYGNGALVVPLLLAPYAIFAGWTWALRRGGRALELAVFVVGLHLGLGVISSLEVLFFPSQPGLTLADAVPGFLLSGAIFVDPAALLAGLVLWIVRRSHGGALPVSVAMAIIAAALLGFLYGLGLGLLAGAGVALAERMPSRTAAIAVAVAILSVVLGNLSIFVAVFA